MKKGSFRVGLWGAGLILLALAAFRIATVVGWIGAASERPATPAGPVGAFGRGAPLPVVSVVAAPVEIGVVEEVAAIPGTLRPQYQVDVFPRRAGRLASVFVDVGDRVEAGDVVAVVEHADLLLQERQSAAGVAASRASLRRAEAQLERARAEYERAALLYEQGAATAQELQAMRNQLQEAEIQRDVAAAQLEQAESNYEMVRLQLAQVEVDTPVGGIVVQRSVLPGMQVSTGTAVATVAALDPIEVLFHVPERDIGRIRRGQPIVVAVDAFPNERFVGYIGQIDAVVDAQTRTVAVRGRVDNPDLRLRPGMFARVEVALGRAEGVALLPREALMTGTSGDYVFVVEDGIVRMRPVVIGLQGREHLEVREGLSEGELIVTVGQQSLRDGQRVQVRMADELESLGPGGDLS